MESHFKKILLDFNDLSKEIRTLNSDLDNEKKLMWRKNLSVLNDFFHCIENSIDNSELKKGFNNAVEIFYFKLRSKPQDEFSILISITTLEYYINRNKENVMCQKLFSKLSNYEFSHY